MVYEPHTRVHCVGWPAIGLEVGQRINRVVFVVVWGAAFM